MSKSSFLNNKALDKANIALACIFAMITGYLLSRPLLSIAMFGFGINALRDIPPRLWVRNKWWLVSVGWVAMYAITYFWSDDKASWGIRLQTKLPFLILPLAIGFMPRFSPKQLQMITVAGLLLLVGSVCYSLSFLLMDHEAMVRNYKYDDVLPTLPGEDHVRVSLCIALFVIWSIYTWPVLQGRKIKWLVGAGIGFLVVYMHILAVRSGLLSLYLFLIGWGIYLSFVKNKLIGLAIIIAIPVFVLFSLRYVPTFRERVNYMDFTWFMFQHGDVSGNYGDINRLMSYTIAADLIKKHPLEGVGVGDIDRQMDTGYRRLYPAVPQEAKLIPHNQFLVIAVGCGIPAAALFAVWVFMPLLRLRRNRESFFFFMVWLLLLLQLMIEPALEVQLGVFVYLFYIMLQKQEMQRTADGRG